MVDTAPVRLQRCPYDGTPLHVDAFSGGSYLLTCNSCAAKWEVHNSMVRRTEEPDWDRARAARAARANSIHMETPAPAH